MSKKELENNIIHEESTEVSADITEFINPFPGLRPFGIEESHLFFGREGQSDEVLEKLSENKFVAILGTSGSGKSSLMYCGLIPTLYGGFMTDAGSNWKVVVTRPGGGPVDNLAESLLMGNKEYANLSEEDKNVKKTITSVVLRSSSLGLIEVNNQLKENDKQNTLILVDQFEELFRYRKLEAFSSNQDESSSFINLLLEAINKSDESIYVVITMRSDFIGECAKFPNLTQEINDSHYLIPQMTREQKRSAIEGPIAVGGGKITSRLTQQLLNEVGDNPDQLPILQHALMRTWTYWTTDRKEGESIDLRHYNAIGTLKEALSMHANEAYDLLNKREKRICELMFKTLTEKGLKTQEGVRRPTKISTIAAICGVHEDEIIKVVNRFREPKRSLLMPPYGIHLNSNTVIDISHESLMRIWTRLKRWLEEESKSAEMYLKLSEAAEKYQNGKTGLWQMPDLQLALNWREENKPTLVWGQRYHPAFERTMVFLKTSERAYHTDQRNKELQQKRNVQRVRITSIILAVAVLVSVSFVIYAFIESNNATKNLVKAEEAAALAEQQRKIADRQKASASESAADALVQKRNAEEAAAQAKENEARAREQEARALESQKRAEAAVIRAQQQTLLAEQQTQLAQQAQQAADNQRKEAERLRFRSVAQSMAIKSKNLTSNVSEEAELKAIVAKQAYDFYTIYKEEGKDYNSDIYAGIYSALQGLYEIEMISQDLNPELGDSAFNQFRKPLSNNLENLSIPAAVRSIAHSKDGQSFYVAYADGEVLKWNTNERTYEQTFKHEGIVRIVNLSPSERYLVLGTHYNDILLFDMNEQQTQTPVRIDAHNGHSLKDIEFLSENKGFISLGTDNRVYKISYSGQATLMLTSNSTDAINTIAISPNNKFLSVGTSTGNVYLLPFDEIIDKISTLEEHTDLILNNASGLPITALHFSSMDKYLAFGNNQGNIFVWDILQMEQVQPTLTGFRSPVTDLEFAPNERLLAASTTNRQIRLWDMQNTYDLPIILTDYSSEYDKGWINDISFDPNGKYFITGAGDGYLRKYPTNIEEMANEICDHIKIGNMNDNEWTQYVGTDITYESTCEDKNKRNIEQ